MFKSIKLLSQSPTFVFEADYNLLVPGLGDDAAVTRAVTVWCLQAIYAVILANTLLEHETYSPALSINNLPHYSQLTVNLAERYSFVVQISKKKHFMLNVDVILRNI